MQLYAECAAIFNEARFPDPERHGLVISGPEICKPLVKQLQANLEEAHRIYSELEAKIAVGNN
jgi:hypothetical protein